MKIKLKNEEKVVLAIKLHILL